MAAKTHIASATASCGTHTPSATNRSAAANCLASSPINNRTSTLVSTARMTLSDVQPDPFLQLRQAPAFWRHREQRPPDVLKRIPPGFANHDPLAVFFPFEYGTGTDTELLPDLRRHGNLSLGGHSGLSESHGYTLPR